MHKAKFKEILTSEYRNFYKIMVNKLFYQIDECIQGEEGREEYCLLLNNKNSVLKYVTNIHEEFEYDFVEVQAIIQFKCELCRGIVTEKYAKPFKAEAQNIATVINELKGFCKDYFSSPINRFHNCRGFEFGLTRIVGFTIEEP